MPSETATTTSAPSGNVEEETLLVVPFSATNGTGTVAISGDDSPVVAWFGSLPSEVSLDLVDADVSDAVSVVEELVSFWFFQDDDSCDVPPNVYVSASDDITDSVGTRYVVKAQGLPPAPVAETTTTTSSTSTTSTTTSSVPETSEAPSTATSSTATTTSSTTTTTTAAVVESPVVLLVQVLNGSDVAGAAGRLTDKLSEAGYAVLSPANAPQRYSSSAVYYQEGWEDRAEEILQASEIEEIDAPTTMPQQFASKEAAVVVLLGTDTAPAVAREQAGLRPRQRNDVRLPLPDSVPRDRYVPGLAAVNLYTEQNENNPDSAGQLADLAAFLKEIGDCSKYQLGTAQPDRCQNRLPLSRLYQAVEDLLEDLGFTPQNVCGAPAGYPFHKYGGYSGVAACQSGVADGFFQSGDGSDDDVPEDFSVPVVSGGVWKVEAETSTDNNSGCDEFVAQQERLKMQVVSGVGYALYSAGNLQTFSGGTPFL